MKKCPQCRAVYGDEMAFCLEDGSALLIAEEEPTVVFQNSAATNPAIKQGVSPIFAYLTVGLLTLILIGGAAAAIIYWKGTDDPPKNNGVTNTAETPRTTPTPLQPTPTPLTTEAVQNLINTWEKAQDARNFALYKSCYDASFTGVKRTVSGGSNRYNYNEWLDDRQKMMSKAKYMDVRVDKMRIAAQGDTATVEFDQYFTTTGYADFGPKVIKVKMTENGAKIVYEELKSSTLVTD